MTKTALITDVRTVAGSAGALRRPRASAS